MHGRELRSLQVHTPGALRPHASNFLKFVTILSHGRNVTPRERIFMRVVGFRIRNFRSIVDTDWCHLSRDGVTALIGQNESGKTSVLEALATTLSPRSITADDIRHDSTLPVVALRVEIEASDHSAFREVLDGFETSGVDAVCAFFKEGMQFELTYSWARNPQARSGFTAQVGANMDSLTVVLDAIASQRAELQTESESTAPQTATPIPSNTPDKALFDHDVIGALQDVAPSFVFFDEDSGLLPGQIDIGEKADLTGQGAVGAKNFLEVAGLNLDELVTADERQRESALGRANAKITRDFTEFWTQTLGKTNRVQFKCDIKHHRATTEGKSGKPYLEFMIVDGQNYLFPRQRSAGVRWFVSFFLQLVAARQRAERSRFGRIFMLLDEPGARLHAKAQTDVIRLIDKINPAVNVLYSTHSPHLVEYRRLYRVLAVQREGDDVDAPTIVIDAHRLAAASRDTLSPIMAAMGIDLSHQNVIQCTRNVILEELSAHYYLRAFWLLFGQAPPPHLIAAQGVDNVPTLANMFLGWGLNFIVVLDDEPSARKVYNTLKRDLFRDDESKANRRLLKIRSAHGIEDVFSVRDFRTHIREHGETSNSAFVKKNGAAKALLAAGFLQRVEAQHITASQLDETSKGNILKLVSDITERLF